MGRSRSYGTLQPDSLEAMRNEYVVALLHAGIHIVMDETNKELSMRPQYGIVGGKSKGRVDYAIRVCEFFRDGSMTCHLTKPYFLLQDAEDLLCITEDKQHKVPIGFAQNIAQLESAYDGTNKRKRKRDDEYFDYPYGIVTTGPLPSVQSRKDI